MKESKNLKATNNNILVGFYMDKIRHEGQLAECLFGLANQTLPVDVVVLDAGLSDKEIEVLNKIAKSPSIKVARANEDGTVNEEIVDAKGGVNLNIIKSDISSFPKIFNTLFNIAFEGGYEAISIIEVDDAVGPNWYDIANLYMQENKEIGFFLPMVRNFQNGTLTGLMNEASWVEGLSEEAGKFDINLLLRFNCANPLGGLFRISELKEYSEERDGKIYPMKESFKISHYYEFFLRMIYNDIKMMTIPRVGYDFRVNNVQEFSHSSSKVPNNLTNIQEENGGMSAKEISFWVELAKSEYFYDNDRCKVFLKDNQ